MSRVKFNENPLANTYKHAGVGLPLSRRDKITCWRCFCSHRLACSGRWYSPSVARVYVACTS